MVDAGHKDWCLHNLTSPFAVAAASIIASTFNVPVAPKASKVRLCICSIRVALTACALHNSIEATQECKDPIVLVITWPRSQTEDQDRVITPNVRV